uniref:Uncharacterized protein n=1 Tax=Anguilla anguilla TaxID=7936 RepID=A0A0E9V8V8_ANGAN
MPVDKECETKQRLHQLKLSGLKATVMESSGSRGL